VRSRPNHDRPALVSAWPTRNERSGNQVVSADASLIILDDCGNLPEGVHLLFGYLRLLQPELEIGNALSQGMGH
jgi:hypothetical protein